MKSAKPAPSEASAHRRSQPARQARTNPPRSSVNTSRAAAGRDEPAGNQPIDIFPAITFFADTLTALPKDLVRHFTLLREVDAKICAPEEQLFELASLALDNNLAGHDATGAAAASLAQSNAPQGAGDATMSDRDASSIPTTDAAQASLSQEQLLLQRRQLFRQISFKIQEMIVSLEEKNHVIGTANEALQRQIARIEDVWPHLENEFTDEAKWGSTTHWAYPENRSGKSTHPERARRDGAAAISAAAQALADEAAARSDARKQAVQAKKNLKNNHQDSDLDDADHRAHKAEGGKKSGAGKVRKTTESQNTGLGITTTANGNPPSKKRKVENAANGGAPGERSGPAAAGGNASKSKAGAANESTGADGPKKRKALPSGSGQSKKKNGMSPSVTSSPVLSSLPEPKGAVRGSPAPNNPSRPTTSRARGNSIQGGGENGKTRPSSSASGKVNGAQAGNGDVGAATSAPRSVGEAQAVKESSVPTKAESKKEGDQADVAGALPPVSTRKETKAEETQRRKSESIPPGGPVPVTVTTKSGRASKPSTPALATFQEAARSRSSRNNDNGGSKKGQKKGGAAAAAAAAQTLAPPMPEDDMTSGEGEGEIDADELTYCYCNGVSYGEMVACDADGCPREWFHLACVGLRVAPAENRKWYCEDCKERLKIGGKKGSGR